MATGVLYRWKMQEGIVLSGAYSTVPGGMDEIMVTGTVTDVNLCATMLRKAAAIPCDGMGPYSVAFGALQTAYANATYVVCTPAGTF